MDTFLYFMKQHQDLARGLIKGDRVLRQELWAELTLHLNASGPPTKDVSAWKRVCINYNYTNHLSSNIFFRYGLT